MATQRRGGMAGRPVHEWYVLSHYLMIAIGSHRRGAWSLGIARQAAFDGVWDSLVAQVLDAPFRAVTESNAVLRAERLPHGSSPVEKNNRSTVSERLSPAPEPVARSPRATPGASAITSGVSGKRAMGEEKPVSAGAVT